MLEGWHGDDYLVLFDETQTAVVSTRYEIGKHLPGYVVVGLKGWDDFIVKGPDGRLSTVPTLPIAAEHLAPLKFPIDPHRIQPDARLRGKVKWYTKPLVFGGDPVDKDNIIWVSFEEHVQLVKWWNDRYRELR